MSISEQDREARNAADAYTKKFMETWGWLEDFTESDICIAFAKGFSAGKGAAYAEYGNVAPQQANTGGK